MDRKIKRPRHKARIVGTSIVHDKEPEIIEVPADLAHYENCHGRPDFEYSSDTEEGMLERLDATQSKFYTSFNSGKNIDRSVKIGRRS